METKPLTAVFFKIKNKWRANLYIAQSYADTNTINPFGYIERQSASSLLLALINFSKQKGDYCDYKLYQRILFFDEKENEQAA